MTTMEPWDAPTETRQVQPSAAPAPARPDDRIEPGRRSQADCCVAIGAYAVVLPPNASRPHSTTLLLCGHHLHVSRAKLEADGASIFDEHNRLIASPSLSSI